MHTARLLSAACLALAAGAVQAIVINIDATHGFVYDGTNASDPAPVFGQAIDPIGARITLALPAGEYRITNAFARGLPGAQHAAWSYNLNTASWTWAYVLANAADDTVIWWDFAGSIAGSAAQVAAQPAVQSYSRLLTLTAPTTLLFTLRDYHVPDNGGGISLDISPVPEPATLALWAAGLAGLAGFAHARRRSGAAGRG